MKCGVPLTVNLGFSPQGHMLKSEFISVGKLLNLKKIILFLTAYQFITQKIIMVSIPLLSVFGSLSECSNFIANVIKFIHRDYLCFINFWNNIFYEKYILFYA